MTPIKALDSLEDAWRLTDGFFHKTVTEDNVLSKPISLRMPFLFYLGHLPSFASNSLLSTVHPRPKTNDYFDELFSRGIDPDVDDPTQCHDHPDAPPVWPTWSAVVEYTDVVRKQIRECVGQGLLTTRILLMVAEHEVLHYETLQYMFVQGFRKNISCCKRAHSEESIATTRSSELIEEEGEGIKKNLVDIEWCRVPAGRTTRGCASDTFSWDNELDEGEYQVDTFRVSKYAISIREYFTFVKSGGYSQQKYWRAEDWKWICSEGLQHPASWDCDGDVKDGYFHILTAGNVHWERVPEIPVSVSLAEARAYAHWRGGYRLTSELEWIRAAYECVDPRPTSVTPHDMCDGPKSVRCGETSWVGTVAQIGNGWELTEGVFDEFDGFQAMSEYKEYSTDFFDGKHFVLKGASWATHPMLVRKSFRNFFQAKYPYVFSKFRLVSDIVDDA